MPSREWVHLRSLVRSNRSPEKIVEELRNLERTSSFWVCVFDRLWSDSSVQDLSALRAGKIREALLTWEKEEIEHDLESPR